MKTRAVKTATKTLGLQSAVLATLVVVTACGGGDQQRRVQPAVPVTVAKVVQKTVPVTFRAIGHVEAIATVAIKARIGGELQKAWFTEGQNVAKGATLFTIDPRQYEAALRLAEAQLTRDVALLAKAEADIKRYEGLVKQDFVTRELYDQIIANAAALRAGVAADQATVDNAKLQLAYCTITAPVEGRTGNQNIDEGNLVKADDATPLVTINQIRPIFAAFSVPAQLLPQVTKHDGNRITVMATLPQNPGPAEEGTLTFVDNVVDTATSTILLKATFANRDDRLWPGQFVDIVVTLGEEPDRIVAPAPAVQTSQQGQYVFVVKDDQTVELRPVKVDRMDEAEAVIDTGVSAGETVVTDGQIRLVPGARVEIKSGVGGAEKGT
ncbi:MAG: efflux RND transporter periplasmic adaptor subunit [Thermoanaerobaculaceae bacterium]|nr:efflux RND transporter periplasmic adaptor subunit [Thermoanaerobaculaceae bacterium]